MVRVATPDDAATIADVQIASWRQSFQNLLTARTLAGLDADEHTRMWQESLSDPDLTTYLGEVNGAIVGFALTGPAEAGAPRPLELKMLYVLESAKGTGLGQELLDTAIGSRSAMLWVAVTNHRARSFYLRNGFEPDGALKTLPRWDNIVNLRVVR